ncbi:hypothetical protein GCM10022627_35170 [Haloarcula argentinensis]|uniref:Uncharacterized protein n=1 Tax=Haloarcula argentinensis TaxID=43776 RepID=A0A830FW59_HALAR|nr:hypothetical protein GCM10009006_33680 [Haloarcula argentinensis]
MRGSDFDRADKAALRFKQLLAADLADTDAALAALELISTIWTPQQTRSWQK